MLFLSSADFFQNQFFRKILSGIRSECQTVWIQIRPDVLSGLIWVQTVCKGHQQTALVGKEFTLFSSFYDSPHLFVLETALLQGYFSHKNIDLLLLIEH